MTDKELNLPPPAAPKGPFADYSAEEVEAYALEYALAVLADRAQQGEPSVEEDAYMHACDEMERFQKLRAKRGVEIGTQGSLCDGIAWLFGRIEELELAATKAAAPADALSLLAKLLTSGAGRAVLDRLAQGMHTETDDGKAWLAAKAIVDRAAPVPESAKTHAGDVSE